MEDSNKYDFETDNINEGDYYSLRAGSNNDNYSVFLYDLICCLFNIFGDINLYLYGMIIVIIEKLLYLFIIKK